MRTAAILGLGLAYGGKQREDVGELLTPLFLDNEVPMEAVGYAGLALGLIFVGSCHKNSVEAILQARAHACLPCGREVARAVRACCVLM